MLQEKYQAAINESKLNSSNNRYSPPIYNTKLNLHTQFEFWLFDFKSERMRVLVFL